MAKCKNCDQDMAEHVNFCPNCGASSKTDKEGSVISAMDEETIYTDEEVQTIAEKLAEKLRNMDYFLFPYLFKTEEYNRGPFGILSLWSREYNPMGGFPVEAEALTMKQRAIITKVVGKGMAQLGRDHPDYEKNKQKAHQRLIDSLRSESGKFKVYGMSRSELEYAKEQGRMDTIIRAINNKK